MKTWYDSDIDNEHICSCGDLLVGAELVLAHYSPDGPPKCTRKLREAKAILQGLTYGDIHTVFIS